MTDHIDKFRRLLNELFRLTQQERIVWNVNDFSGNPNCRLGNFNIELERGVDSEGDSYSQLMIKNMSDEEVDSFYDFNVNGSPPDHGFSSYSSLMVDLYNKARRSAVGADKALDEILNEASLL